MRWKTTKMKYREIEFESKKIRGFFYENGFDLVLVFHGFTGNKVDHHGMLRTFSEEIVEMGYSVFRFDFLGCGDSDGTFYEDESIAYQIQQGIYLVHQFRQEGYNVHLFGFSLGGIIAAHTAVKTQASSLFLLSPAGNFHEILPMMLNEKQEVNGFMISDSLIQEAQQFSYFDGIFDYEGNVKIVQGNQDQYVSFASYKKFKEGFKKGEGILIEKADHCFSSTLLSNQVRKEIRNFYGKEN